MDRMGSWLAASLLVSLTCCGRTDLHLAMTGAGGTMVIADAAGTGDATGISGPRGTGGQSTAGSQLPANAVPVCVYTESGPEHTVSVFRDVAKTNYYLVSGISPTMIVQPIGTPAARVLVDRVADYEYLYAQVLSGGTIQFVDATNSFDEVCEDQGPSQSFSSTCREDGIQITELFKDSTLYVLFNRPDGSVYHGDIDGFWTLESGTAVINFYTADPGTTIHSLVYDHANKTATGTHAVTISEPPQSVRTISFTDLDDHPVTVDLDVYVEVVDTPATRH
jgi:hypothetical protein